MTEHEKTVIIEFLGKAGRFCKRFTHCYEGCLLYKTFGDCLMDRGYFEDAIEIIEEWEEEI